MDKSPTRKFLANSFLLQLVIIAVSNLSITPDEIVGAAFEGAPSEEGQLSNAEVTGRTMELKKEARLKEMGRLRCVLFIFGSIHGFDYLAVRSLVPSRERLTAP